MCPNEERATRTAPAASEMHRENEHGKRRDQELHRDDGDRAVLRRSTRNATAQRIPSISASGTDIAR
jgi:hypothetical protein